MVDVEGFVLSKRDKKRLSHPMAGAVILFTKNFKNKKQLIELINDIKLIRRPALLVSVDQEGGRIQRFRDDFTLLPSAADIGEVYDRCLDTG